MSTSVIPPTPTARGRVGRLGGFRDIQPEKFAAAQLDLKAAKLRDAIQQAVDEAPPLTPAQVDALQALLATAVAR